MAETDNKYYEIRTNAKLSRQVASNELFDGLITADRLYRIEQNKQAPTPEEVCWMADGYKTPELKNYYCNHECAIGKSIGVCPVGEINKSRLPMIVLDLLSSLNSIQKDKLIDISADGEIDESEMKDFVEISQQLDRISHTVECLKLWSDKHIKKNNG